MPSGVIVLLGVGIGLVLFGVALFLLGGVLHELSSGWRADAARWATWVALVVGAVGSVPYFLGPNSLDVVMLAGAALALSAFLPLFWVEPARTTS